MGPGVCRHLAEGRVPVSAANAWLNLRLNWNGEISCGDPAPCAHRSRPSAPRRLPHSDSDSQPPT